ncbi:hypothetical protein PENFLA_c010G03600 [Penicillium flavigenum]|uniref:Uncharacterized protein n=1 Tax=Penicillium flavigenum TaxID=254877 RepID=A0A1V6TCS4_9EURO|nr:hypothetical protein PENFLA_c010G03600 [Penicillium flavigenum]
MTDSSSSQPAAVQPTNRNPNRDWHAKQDVAVADQAVDLPEIGSLNLYKITPPLKERTDLDMWIDQVEKTLRSHKLHNLVNKEIPWPVVDDPNGDKWRTLSLQVRIWLSSSIDHGLMQEINGRGNATDFADELFDEIKKHMKGEGHGALKAAMNSFRKISRTQFATSEDFIHALKLRYKTLCDLEGRIPPYYALQSMLSELIEVPELSIFIIVKDNELSAVQDPVHNITTIDFYRYSTAILDFIKSSNADSLLS